MDYKNAGVDIEAGYKSVELMKEHVKGTMRPEVLGGIGGFSGAFSMSAFKDMEKPTLVSGTDGVGTKLKLAFLMDKHNTVGIDCVAMCVNDIACAGGEPLFFLDYIACGKNFPEKIAEIVGGVADGCKQAGAALIGGETAEMPGFYPEDEYDLAGFAVGVVDEKNLITGKDLKAGDVLIGMASSGVHSNGSVSYTHLDVYKRQVYQAANAVKIPIIGMGGIMNAEDALEFILAGATAVSVGTANFHNPYATAGVVSGIESYMKKYNVEDINDLVGAVR